MNTLTTLVHINSYYEAETGEPSEVFPLAVRLSSVC